MSLKRSCESAKSSTTCGASLLLASVSTSFGPQHLEEPGRVINGPGDLTFGEYIRLLQDSRALGPLEGTSRSRTG